uniref:Peptidase S1 domain-containing protein n=1 Tax=Anisakis simplex TaxID=6269 RepID=A0A0M3JXN0_ANISI
LCSVRDTVPCKGYGECVLVKWLMDGKNDCLDGSDEDKDYVIAFGFMSALNWITFQPITPMQHPKPHFSIEHHSPKSGDTQSKSLLQPTEDIGEVDSDKWMLSISHHLKTPFDTHKTTAVNSLSSSNVATDYFHSHFSHHGDTPPANPFSSFYTSLIPLSTPLPATTNPPITDNYPLSVPTKTTLPSSFPSLYVHHIAPPFPPTSSPQNEHLLSSTRYESLTFLHSTLPTSTPLPLHSMPPLFHETTLSALSPFIDQLKSFESSSSLSYPLNPVSLSPPTTLTDNTITNVPLLSSNNPYLHNNVHPVSTPEYTLSPLSFGVPADRLSPQSAFSTIRSPHLIPYISSSESSLLKLNQNHVIQSPLGSHFQTKQPQPSQTNEMTFLSALLSSTPSSASLRFSIIPTQRTSTVDYHHSTATITNEEVKWHILKTKTDECIKSLQKKAMQKYPNPICECPAGQMRVGSAQKCQRLFHLICSPIDLFYRILLDSLWNQH